MSAGLREALLSARPYVESACGAKGLTRGMAEQNLKRIDSALAGLAPSSVSAGLRTFEIRICDDCYVLKGKMCHNPECVFIRRTMAEVSELLDTLLIRPIVDGERFDLHPLTAAALDGQGDAAALPEQEKEQDAAGLLGSTVPSNPLEGAPRRENKL